MATGFAMTHKCMEYRMKAKPRRSFHMISESKLNALKNPMIDFSIQLTYVPKEQ